MRGCSNGSSCCARNSRRIQTDRALRQARCDRPTDPVTAPDGATAVGCWDCAGVLSLALLIVYSTTQHATILDCDRIVRCPSSAQPGSAMTDKPNAAVAAMATASSPPPRPAALMCRITGGVRRALLTPHHAH